MADYSSIGGLGAVYKSGGLTTRASAKQRKQAWIWITNNDNKGVLEVPRVRVCPAPSMALDQHNSQMIHMTNNTEGPH